MRQRLKSGKILMPWIEQMGVQTAITCTLICKLLIKVDLGGNWKCFATVQSLLEGVWRFGRERLFPSISSEFPFRGRQGFGECLCVFGTGLDEPRAAESR